MSREGRGRIEKVGSAAVTDTDGKIRGGGKRLDEREFVGWLRGNDGTFNAIKKTSHGRSKASATIARATRNPSAVAGKGRTMSLENVGRTFTMYKSATWLTERKILLVERAWDKVSLISWKTRFSRYFISSNKTRFISYNVYGKKSNIQFVF